MRDDLKTRDIARLLRVSEETVRQYARDGRIPFHTTPGGHRRFDAEAVLAALGADRPHVPATISVGPSHLADIPAGASSINFDAAAPTTRMATEVAARSGSERREPLPAPPAANRVHASLMRWAQSARVPQGAGH
jgi:excisionase family DNA binding protein